VAQLVVWSAGLELPCVRRTEAAGEVTPASAQEVLEEAARREGVRGAVESYGESWVLRGHVDGRGCDIGLGRQLLWVAVDTDWDLPERAFVLWSPAGSYERTRMLHEDGPWAETGDAAFDAIFLVGGEEGAACVDRLTKIGRKALCDAAWVRPGLSWLDLAPPRRRRHVSASPPLQPGRGRRGKTVNGPYVATCVAAALAVARGVERR